MKLAKKTVIGMILGVLIIISGPAVALAETVYYNGTPVNWDHGRKNFVTSYSEVQSHVYDHAATANNTFSGWVGRDDGAAYAEQTVGIFPAVAYWDCRG